MTFIVDDIISENGLTGSTLYTNTLYSNSVSATTFYGDGSEITYNKVSANISSDSVLFNNYNILSGHTSFEYSGNTLFFTGTTRFNNQFFIQDSASAKLRLQWFGSVTVGTAPGIVWTNQPLALATWLSGTVTADATYIVDLTEYTQCRLYMSLQVAAATVGAAMSVQWSTNNSTWDVLPLATVVIGNTTGAKDSGWTSIPAGARRFVYIRLVGAGGNGTVDPRFSPPTLLIR